jgi:cytochrome b subunit of formate dehydrogenase
MPHPRVILALAGSALLLWPAAWTWAQQAPYTYIRASLQVPWALYFFFLLLIFLPFIFMVLLAWSNSAQEKDEQARIAAEDIPNP